MQQVYQLLLSFVLICTAASTATFGVYTRNDVILLVGTTTLSAAIILALHAMGLVSWKARNNILLLTIILVGGMYARQWESGQSPSKEMWMINSGIILAFAIVRRRAITTH